MFNSEPAPSHLFSFLGHFVIHSTSMSLTHLLLLVTVIGIFGQFAVTFTLLIPYIRYFCVYIVLAIDAVFCFFFIQGLFVVTLSASLVFIQGVFSVPSTAVRRTPSVAISVSIFLLYPVTRHLAPFLVQFESKPGTSLFSFLFITFDTVTADLPLLYRYKEPVVSFPQPRHRF